MAASELLAELKRRGVELAVAGAQLRYRPKDAVTPELRAAMVGCKADLLRLLADDDHQVRWRADAMRPQVPPTGPIPFLVVCSAPPAAGSCLSCGDPLEPGRGCRCEPCVEAVQLVLNEVREGVRRDDLDITEGSSP